MPTYLFTGTMQFFIDFYKDEEKAPEKDSKEWLIQNTQIEKLGNDYILYLKKIYKKFPENFLNVYFENCQFQGWDLNKLEFNHDIYNHPFICMTLTHVNIDKVIKLEYLNVKSFFTDLKENYFHFYEFGKPGIIGVNEFMLYNDYLSHEIYFNSPESIKICFEKINVSVIDI